MPEFRSIADLNRYLIKVLKDSMEDVGRAVEHKVREKIEEEVYQNPTTPSMYERTGELKNSLIHTQPKQIGNEIVTEIKHDDNLIGHYEPNQHMSVVDGRDMSVESLAEIVNFGKAGHIFGTGYWTEPRPYIEDARQEVIDENLHYNTLKKSLQSKGLKVE